MCNFLSTIGRDGPVSPADSLWASTRCIGYSMKTLLTYDVYQDFSSSEKSPHMTCAMSGMSLERPREAACR